MPILKPTSASAPLQIIQEPPRESSYTIRHFHGKAGLIQLESAWKSITTRMERIRYYHLYDFMLSYLEHMEQHEERVCFYQISRNGSPVAIVSLALRTVRICGLKVNILKLYPDTNHLDYTCDCLSCDSKAPALELVLQNLSETHCHWHFMTFKSLVTARITHHLEGLKDVPFTRLDSSGSASIPQRELRNVAQKLHTKPKSRCNQNLKMLKKLGNVEVRMVDSTDNLQEALTQFMILEDSGWKGEQQTSIRCRERFHHFYRQLTERLGKEGISRFIFLTLDGKPVAGHLLWVIGKTCYVPRVAYDETYAKMGPGRVMCEKLYEQLAECVGVESCNFIGFPKWLTTWDYETTAAYRYLVFRPNLGGLLAARLTPSCSNLAKKLKPLTNRLR